MTIADLVRFSPTSIIRLKARWVVPVHMPPIENGEVIIEDGVIVSIGKAPKRHASECVDMGLVALMPGFVNAHSHVENTIFRGYVEDLAFFPWLRRLSALKAHVGMDDWITSATMGVAEMLAAGVTTIGDCSEAGATLHALLASGMRGTVYREVFGLDALEPKSTQADADARTLAVLWQRVAEMRGQVSRMGVDDRVTIGVSPHAPYTVPPSLFAPIAEQARTARMNIQIHVAESREEEELLLDGQGVIAEHLRRNGISWTAPQTSPVQYVAACGGFEAPAVAVHCIHIDPDDARLLRIKDVAVAHCPKANGKLANGIMPLSMLLREGVTVGLGTDGMASNNVADIFEEMRFALYQCRAKRQDVTALSARDVLEMATLGGAKCLRQDDFIGTLKPGKRADVIAVGLDGIHLQPTVEDDPISALVYSARSSDVRMTMVGGQVLFESGQFTLIDMVRLRGAFTQIRARLRAVKGQERFRG